MIFPPSEIRLLHSFGAFCIFALANLVGKTRNLLCGFRSPTPGYCREQEAEKKEKEQSKGRHQCREYRAELAPMQSPTSLLVAFGLEVELQAEEQNDIHTEDDDVVNKADFHFKLWIVALYADVERSRHAQKDPQDLVIGE